jgi:hypothetical protein
MTLLLEVRQSTVSAVGLHLDLGERRTVPRLFNANCEKKPCTNEQPLRPRHQTMKMKVMTVKIMMTVVSRVRHRDS